MKQVSALAIILAMAPPAAVSSVYAQGSTCFEVIPARPNIEPAAPIMIDKCSGRTWILVRGGKSYRWSLITTEAEKPKIEDRAPIGGSEIAPSQGGQKCFTFNGRRFCE